MRAYALAVPCKYALACLLFLLSVSFLIAPSLLRAGFFWASWEALQVIIITA